MTDPLEIAQKYFALSNKSDMAEIEKMFRSSSTYSSENTGLFLGAKPIMAMQEAFHDSFQKLHWHISSVEEVKPAVIKFDFTFTGTKHNGQEVKLSGVEYVVIHDGKIQHIEIRNK